MPPPPTGNVGIYWFLEIIAGKSSLARNLPRDIQTPQPQPESEPAMKFIPTISAILALAAVGMVLYIAIV